MHDNTGTVANHFAMIDALTQKENTQTAVTSPVITSSPILSFLFSPLVIYGSIVLFITLFIGAVFIQFISRVLDWKRTSSSFVVALLIAIMPLSIRVGLEATSLRSFAGPDEVPRKIEIKQVGSSVQISWETDALKAGSVRYHAVGTEDDVSFTAIADFGKRTKQHIVIIENIKKGIEYEFEILSGSGWYDNNGKPLQFRLTGS